MPARKALEAIVQDLLISLATDLDIDNDPSVQLTSTIATDNIVLKPG